MPKDDVHVHPRIPPTSAHHADPNRSPVYSAAPQPRATTRKATHAVVDNVIPKLSDDQAKVSAEYALSLLKLGPKRDDIR